MRLGWPAALRPNGPLSSIALADTSARLKGTRRSWNSPGTATVEIELATPEGSTVVTLVHRSLDDRTADVYGPGWIPGRKIRYGPCYRGTASDVAERVSDYTLGGAVARPASRTGAP